MDLTRQLISEFRKTNNSLILHRLFKEHHKLICAIANRYTGLNISKEMLIAEGTLGLLQAIEKFDLSKTDVKFSTYAFYWIKAHMFTFINKFFANKYSIPQKTTKLLDDHDHEIQFYKKPIIQATDETWQMFDLCNKTMTDKSNILHQQLKKLHIVYNLLTPLEQQILDARWFKTDKTLKELAEQLHMPLPTLQKTEQRLFQKIREKLSILSELEAYLIIICFQNIFLN